MSWLRPHLAAPTRLSGLETLRAIRRARGYDQTPTLHQLWRNVSADRLFDAPRVLSASGAAWALCVELRWIYKAIRNKTLPAQREDLPDGRFRWRILLSDVEKIAETLNGGVSRDEEPA